MQHPLVHSHTFPLSHKILCTMPPVSICYTLFFIIASTELSAAHSCSRQPVLSIDPDPDASHKSDFCIRAATVRSAFAMQVFANGSCQLIYACSILNTTLQPALYMRLRPASSVLLLRTVADTQPHAYDLLTKGTPNTTNVLVDRLLGQSLPYMSSLVAMDPSPFSHVHVQLFDNATLTPAVNITFRAEDTQAIKEGKWFLQDRLEAAFPWDVDVMKSEKFEIFSMKGWSRRRFFLLTTRGGCTEFSGYMFLYKLTEKVQCNYDKGRFVNGNYYLYIHNGPKLFSSPDSKELFEFRIVGQTISASTLVYVRIE